METKKLYLYLKMFGAMHFIYYINRSIATKVDSIYLDYRPTPHNICLVASGGREPVTFRSLFCRFAATPHM